jgi:Na+/proline symporter
MAEHTVATGNSRVPDTGAISVPFIVLASVLVGLGIMGLAYWLITFQWVLMLSIAPLAIGGLLFFTRAAGPDRA